VVEDGFGGVVAVCGDEEVDGEGDEEGCEAGGEVLDAAKVEQAEFVDEERR